VKGCVRIGGNYWPFPSEQHRKSFRKIGQNVLVIQRLGPFRTHSRIKAIANPAIRLTRRRRAVSTANILTPGPLLLRPLSSPTRQCRDPLRSAIASSPDG